MAREGLNVQRRNADLLKVRLPGTHDRHTVRTSWGDDPGQCQMDAGVRSQRHRLVLNQQRVNRLVVEELDDP